MIPIITAAKTDMKISHLFKSTHWAIRVARVSIIGMLIWWLFGAPNLLAQFGVVDEWSKTDFSKHSVSMSEIISGGPGKDGIPAIDDPKFLPATDEIDWLDVTEPVIALIVKDDAGREHARAYPIQILMWHEIVNDELAGIPVSVTFCPLCNASIVFDRRLNGTVYDFGTTGRLRKSDMVMYDRQTESWWQQFLGQAIVGELTGAELNVIPSRILSWGDFKTAWPDGKVLSKDTGYLRRYGINPYQGYDDINQNPFLLGESPDPRLKPMDRVAVLKLNNGYRAYPYSVLESKGIVHDVIDDQPIVFFTRKNTRSPLDKRLINASRLMISAQAFSPVIHGQSIQFYLNKDDEITDRQTASVWSLAGKAVSGKLTGQSLDAIATDTHFAFAWLVFRPDTEIYK